jgi:hypothetical protein
MTDKGLSDKERALLQSARREVAAKVKRQEVVDTAGLAASSSRRGSTAARTPPREARKLSPLEAQTVLGWDHPAAQKPVSAADDKWARIAKLMEAERREAAGKRAKIRRVTTVLFACLVLLVAIMAVKTLIR